MKPKQLRFPFSWEQRAPTFLQGVLFIPRYYEAHQGWCRQPLQEKWNAFSRVYVEYCSGNGVWIAEKALASPEVLWIAVEKRFDRVQRIWSKKENLALSNLLIICGDALTWTKEYVSLHSIDGFFVNFPDPWPKAKHAKNRLLQSPFIQELYRVTKPKGEGVVVTDDLVYSEQVIREMVASGLWESAYPEPYYVTQWPLYGESYFGQLWQGLGREIRYMRFIAR